MTKNETHRPKQDDFIAPARRAFQRVARKLRLENKGLRLRVNLPVNGAKNLKSL